MTQRLILRAWREDDAKSLYRLASDSRVSATAGWRPHRSQKESLAVIRDVYSQSEIYALVLRSTGEIIGSVGLMTYHNSNIGLSKTDCELGYWLGVPYWENGYCTEAAEALIRRAFEELSMQRVFCSYIEGNVSSQKVQQKLGFSPHHVNQNVYWDSLGTSRTEYVSCMSRQDWFLKNTKKYR
jgi:RimJ/RimL family protein N-acetyltransferase